MFRQLYSFQTLTELSDNHLVNSRQESNNYFVKLIRNSPNLNSPLRRRRLLSTELLSRTAFLPHHHFADYIVNFFRSCKQINEQSHQTYKLLFNIRQNKASLLSSSFGKKSYRDLHSNQERRQPTTGDDDTVWLSFGLVEMRGKVGTTCSVTSGKK